MKPGDYQIAIAKALATHPDCSFADWDNGLDLFFNRVYVVKLWRNEECYLAGDPPKYVENWPTKQPNEETK